MSATARPTGAARCVQPLTVAADGRFSRMRKLAQFEPVPQSDMMEVLWFRFARLTEDRHEQAGITVGRREVVAVLGRTHEWQIGYVGPKGRYHELKAAGLDALRQSIAAALPWLADRVTALSDWSDVSLLSVEASRVTRWHRSGLLLIGDAAHVMLPIGGVGINCAVADAVEAANVLIAPLQEARVQESDLAEVQRRREWITRVIQRFQGRIQRNLLSGLHAGRIVTVPLPLRIILRVPGLRNLPGRVVAFGVRRVRLQLRP